MNMTPGTSKDAADKLVRGIKRKTRKHYSAEEKIRIVPAGLRGEESISALYRREGIAESLYYSWSKRFLGAALLKDACACGGLFHGTKPPCDGLSVAKLNALREPALRLFRKDPPAGHGSCRA